MRYLKLCLFVVIVLVGANSTFARPERFIDQPVHDSGLGYGKVLSTTVFWECTFDDPSDFEGWSFGDAGDQESRWRTTDMSTYNRSALSWVCTPSWIIGSYQENSLQGLVTPAMDLSSCENVSLNFNFMVRSEEEYDGGCVMIWYGANEEEANRVFEYLKEMEDDGLAFSVIECRKKLYSLRQ